MGVLAEKGRGLSAYLAVRTTADPQHAQRLIADAMPPAIASLLEPAELESIRQRLIQLPEQPARAGLAKDDWLVRVRRLLLVFFCTLPVGLPFLFMQQLGPAMRVSNAIAVAMLFVTGWAFGSMTGRRPWLVGIAMVAIGAALVGMTMALGG